VGGAELLLQNTIDALPEFEHLVVYFFQREELMKAFRQKGTEVICLQQKSWRTLPLTLFKLNAIIRKRRPILVHSHLFYGTVCTRLATPASVPLVSTLHSLYSEDAFAKNFKSLLAARLTLKKRHSLIAVSKHVLKDYLDYVPFKGKRFVLYNFLPDALFQNLPHGPVQGTIKLVAVGNLKEAKNYPYLLEVFKYLKGVSLDIYGEGFLEKKLLNRIEKEKLDVRLCGSTNNIPDLFQQYDFFIQASSHEGFGLSVIEAMASGIPAVLSDIPVFREITNGLAHFFPLDNARQAAGNLMEFFNKPYPAAMADEAYRFVKQNYSASRYRQNLLSIYESITQRKLLHKPEETILL
jgi:glycosyltransferase involved in cell wall biosynthesis